ncbi:MAG: hydroxyacylglutathione hydrolase [Polyangiaceae bacterium]|nr:hydroxyacylglutathione hydrolase [Polyangiaceae bacterium]
MVLVATPIPCLRDNYAYVIEGGGRGQALVVDPSESQPVLQVLRARKLCLSAILVTHHHFDHVGGVQELLASFPEAPVFAMEPDASKVKGVTRRVQPYECLEVSGVIFQVLPIPGHTMGAVAFLLPQTSAPGLLFTGDTLFTAGCGRLFEGTPADMNRSLNEILGALPDDTQVYCGHEYTEANLRFAVHVEPGNEAIRKRILWTAKARSRGEPTVPSTLGEERATNPFLRVGEATVRTFVGLGPGASRDEVFAKVRAAKDTFL